MASCRLVLNRLMLRGWLAVIRLRGAYPTDMDGSERGPFDRLRERADATGLSICTTESPYVSKAMPVFRPASPCFSDRHPISPLPDELRAPLRDCARRLKAADKGLHLRLTPPVRPAGYKHVRPTRRVVNASARIEPRHFLQRSTLQSKMFAFVCDRGLFTASELRLLICAEN